MRYVELADCQALTDEEMVGMVGGTGSPELAHDIGVVVGAVAGAFYLLGKGLYENGGLFGSAK
jgi:hypothetical protein